MKYSTCGRGKSKPTLAVSTLLFGKRLYWEWNRGLAGLWAGFAHARYACGVRYVQ
ncbi:MAG: hypothetical protein IKH13_09085 [Clostridia bacterium]|nr:hypothetical protein [Clostridia bacterium]